MWLDFLAQTFQDPTLIAYVQRVVGYCLTAATDEQAIFFLFGQGENGKTVLVETVRGLLGDGYARTLEARALTTARGGASNDLAALKGARLVVTNETASGDQLETALVKLLTGGDVITARFLYREFFQFRPQFKLLVTTNHEPTIPDAGHGMWRRVRVIPFSYAVGPADRVPNLHALMLELEGPGILAWAVEGARAWCGGGLAEPALVTDAIAAYRVDQDELLPFIRRRCVLDPTAYTSRSELYDWYVAFCKGRPALGIGAFGNRLKLLPNVLLGIKHNGHRSIRGIRINPTLDITDLLRDGQRWT